MFQESFASETMPEGLRERLRQHIITELVSLPPQPTPPLPAVPLSRTDSPLAAEKDDPQGNWRGYSRQKMSQLQWPSMPQVAVTATTGLIAVLAVILILSPDIPSQQSVPIVALIDDDGTALIVQRERKQLAALATGTETTLESDDIHVTIGSQTVEVHAGEQLQATLGQELRVQAQPLQGASTELSKSYVTTWTEGTVLYERPNVEGQHLGLLSSNQQMFVVATTEDGDWYLLCCLENGSFGWVDGDSVELSNELDEIFDCPLSLHNIL